MTAQCRLRLSSLETFHVETIATRIEPANAIGANDKIRWIENVPLDQIEHRTIDLGRSASIKSNMNFDDPSLPSCMMPIVGS